MRFATFQAEPDLIGQRIRLLWELVLEGADSLADIPEIRVRRKTRDFNYPPPPAGPTPDPYLVYDSARFPPGAPGDPNETRWVELPGWEIRDPERDTRTIVSVSSVSQLVHVEPGVRQRIEVIRRTVATTYGADGLPLSQRVEVLDTGPLPVAAPSPGTLLGLQPGVTYYYRLHSPLLEAPPPATPARPLLATATASNVYGLNRALYDLLPEIFRSHDTRHRPEWEGTGSVPEAAPRSGQLRRFFDLFGIPMDWTRSLAENVRTLHDINANDFRYLPLLAHTIGWRFADDSDIPLKRNELKSAPRLYRRVGTIPSLQALTERYTGWTTEVVEYASHIGCTNAAPQMRVYALDVTALPGSPDAVERRSADDAALLLGFGPGNDDAAGSAGAPASLVGSQAEPFALRAGMSLTVATDGIYTETVVFGPDDFAHIEAATAAEIALVLADRLSNVEALPGTGGVIRLTSSTIGPSSRLRVHISPHRPITLEGSPSGRPAVAVEGSGRVRLLYDGREDGRVGGPERLPRDPADEPVVRVKTFSPGVRADWSDAQPVPLPATPVDSPPGSPPARYGSPAACILPDGRLWVGAVENPDTASSRIVTVAATVEPPEPAVLRGQRRGPFDLTRPVTVSVLGDWLGPEDIPFTAADFATPASVPAADVAAVLNSRATRLNVSVAASGALVLTSVSIGRAAELKIDLRHSRNLDAIGFAHPVKPGTPGPQARGQWEASLSWSPASAVPSLSPGWLRDASAVVDGNGDLHLFCVRFRQAPPGFASWQIVETIFNGATWSPLADVSDPTTTPGGSFEPQAARDPGGNVHLFWSRADPGASTRSIRRRIYDAATRTWGPEDAVTVAPTGPADPPGVADSFPSPVATGNPGEMRVFFTSTRGGGTGLWECTAVAGGGGLVPVPVMTGAAISTMAAPVAVDGRLWLLHRSDRAVTRTLPPSGGLLGTNQPSLISQVARSAMTRRRYAGTTTVRLGHLSRANSRGTVDDFLAYTPQRPLGSDLDSSLQPDERYSPGTVGLFLTDAMRGTPLVGQNVERLRQLLTEYLPFSMRVVVAVTPTDFDPELVYPPGSTRPSDLYIDDYPFVEYVAATPVTDETTVVLPDNRVLLTNTVGDTTVDPAAPPSLRARTYFPPPV